MHRNMTDILEEWTENKDRKVFVLTGNRSTGKTSLVEDFADSSELIGNMICFDCLKEGEKLVGLLGAKDITVKEKVSGLEGMANDRIHFQTTLLFFDNIESCPVMLEILPILYKESSLHFILAAGRLSRVSSYLNGDIEEHRLYPLSFEEFLEAYDEKLYKNYERSDCQETFYHKALLDAFHWYLVSGGMPECVQTILETKDPEKVQPVQKKILDQYRKDFFEEERLLSGERMLASFDSIPAQLSKKNPKFMYNAVPGGYEARSLKIPVEKLIDDEIIFPVKEAGHEEYFIPFLFDTGLLKAMAGISAGDILEDRDFPFKEIFFQNFIVQQLHQTFDLTYEATKHGRHDILKTRQEDSASYKYDVEPAHDPKNRKRYQQNREGDWIVFSEEPYNRKGKYRFVSVYMVHKLQEILH